MVIANTRPTNLSLSASDIFQIFLEDEDGQSILGIDDGALRQSLHIRIVNTSGKDIKLTKIDTDTIDSTHYNFAVSFRLGTLLDISSIKFDEANGWKMYPNNNTFYFGISEDKTLTRGESITLTLENIGAAPAGGSRGTRVEVKYDNLKYQGSDDRLSGSRLLYLNIVNHRGKKQVPLYAGFLGSNTILNDGTENELTLSIQLLPLLNFSLEIKSLQNASDLTKFDINSTSQTIDANKLTTKQIQILQRVILDQKVLDTLQKVLDTLPTFLRSISTNNTQNLRNLQSSIQAVLNIFNTFKNFSDSRKTDPINFDKISSTQYTNTKQLFQSLRDLDNDLRKLNINNVSLVELTNQIIDQFISQFVTGEDYKTISQDILMSFVSIVKDLGLSLYPEMLSKLNEVYIIGNKNKDENKKRELKSTQVPLKNLDEGIKFTISFDVAPDEKLEASQWALVSQNDAVHVSILPVDGTTERKNWISSGQQKQGITPQWSFIYTEGLNLENRQEILRLSIKNLKTQLLSGYANLYVHYENIPGYWDGFITVPIHKGPLVYRQYEEPSQDHHHIDFVGIGVIKPQAMLHIKPPESHKDDLALKVEGNTAIAGNLAVTGGKVGIGITPSPQQSEQLRVQGNTAIAGNLAVTGGKVGIGITPSPQQSEQLRVQGNTAIAGNLAITNSSNHLQLIRKSTETTGGKQLFLELYQEQSSSNFVNVYPSIRFHHSNRFWKRLEARENGFHFKDGNMNSDDYVPIIAGKLALGGSSDFSKEPLVIRATQRQESLIAFEDPNGVKKWHIEQNFGGNTSGLNFVETGVADFRLFIQKNSGNVGIGTGDPSSGKLVIQQTKANEGIVLRPYNNTNKDFRIGFEENSDVLFFYVYTDNANPKGQYMTADGKWNLNSDISLKQEISSLNSILNQVIQLNPVRFIWKDTKLISVGFIAQEVAQIFPELVSSINTGKGELKGLAYTDFGVLAIAAIKEVAENLQELKQKYDDLAIVNQDLQRRLEKLENRD